MKKTGEDLEFEYFQSDFHGIPVRIMKNRITNDVLFNSNDVARCLGFSDFNALLGSDAGLDAVNKWKKDHPDRPVFGEDGMFMQI